MSISTNMRYVVDSDYVLFCVVFSLNVSCVVLTWYKVFSLIQLDVIPTQVSELLLKFRERRGLLSQNFHSIGVEVWQKYDAFVDPWFNCKCQLYYWIAWFSLMILKCIHETCDKVTDFFDHSIKCGYVFYPLSYQSYQIHLKIVVSESIYEDFISCMTMSSSNT